MGLGKLAEMASKSDEAWIQRMRTQKRKAANRVPIVIFLFRYVGVQTKLNNLNVRTPGKCGSDGKFAS